jgi:uncharacterized delta-60 repeat protein
MPCAPVSFFAHARARGAVVCVQAAVVALALVLALLALGAQPAHALPGQLDSSFNPWGTLPGTRIVGLGAPGTNPSLANAVAIDSNGRVVVAGRADRGGTTGADVLVARFLTNGELDTSFGTNGAVTFSVGPGVAWDEATALALTPTDEIIVAGWADMGGETGRDVFVTKLAEDGSFVDGFNGGLVKTLPVAPASGADEARGVGLRPDGTIVVVGRASMGGSTGWDAFALSVASDGQSNSTLWLSSFSGSDTAAGVVTYPNDDRFAIVGTSNVGGNPGPFVMLLGTAPAGWNEPLKLTSVQGTGLALALAASSIFVAGHTEAGEDSFVARVDETTGTLVAAFQSSGIGTYPRGDTNQPDTAAAIQVEMVGGQPRLIVAGDAVVGGNRAFVVSRLLLDGNRDASWNGGEDTITQLSEAEDRVSAAAVKGNRIVLAGRSLASGHLEVALARYIGGFFNPSMSLDVPVCSPNFGEVASGTSKVTDVDCTLSVTTNNVSGVSLLLSRINATAMTGPGTVADYQPGGQSWSTGNSSMFGVCLRAVTAMVPSWTTAPDSECRTNDGPEWRAVPPADAPTAIASTNGPTTGSASVHLRFGVRTAANIKPGLYMARIMVTAVVQP